MKWLASFSVFCFIGGAQAAEQVGPPGDRCVPESLVRGLFGLRARGITVGALPPSFPPEALPPATSLLGSIEFASSERVVALSAAEPTRSLERAMENLVAHGWTNAPLSRAMATGFVTQQEDRSGTFCHEEYGFLSVEVAPQPEGEGSLVSLSHSAPSDGGRCSTEFRAQLGRAGETLEAYMPRLLIPGTMVGGGGGGGGRSVGDSHRRDVVVKTDESVDAIFDHLLGQLETLEWILDSVWEGLLSSGSTWSFEAQDGLQLVGTLSVTSLPGDRIEASLRILNVGNSG